MCLISNDGPRFYVKNPKSRISFFPVLIGWLLFGIHHIRKNIVRKYYIRRDLITQSAFFSIYFYLFEKKKRTDIFYLHCLSFLSFTDFYFKLSSLIILVIDNKLMINIRKN